jgi:hypothetical protein
MSRATVALLNQGVAPQSIWDGVFDGAGELLMRAPGILSLHAVTCANALRYAWQQAREDDTRRFLLLQAASFMPLFRNRDGAKDYRIDALEPLAPQSNGPEGLEEIFGDVGTDRLTAARKTLAWLDASDQPETFLHAARLMIFLKGRDAHDYKFSSAVLEDHRHLSPAWRNRFLAASMFYWRGTGGADNELVGRVRAALA